MAGWLAGWVVGWLVGWVDGCRDCRKVVGKQIRVIVKIFLLVPKFCGVDVGVKDAANI